MIDLNYKRQEKKGRGTDEDWPLGIQILVLIPFAVFFWAMLTASFLHGIY